METQARPVLGQIRAMAAQGGRGHRCADSRSSSCRKHFHPGHYAFAVGLGDLLAKVQANGDLYPLMAMDRALIEESAAIYADYGENIPSGDLVDKLGL